MKTQAQLVEYVRSNPGITARKMVSNLGRHGVNYAMAHEAMALAHGGPTVSKPQPQSVGQPVSLLIDQFDDVKKVRQAMKEMPADHYEEDDVLRRRLHVSPDRWRVVAGHPDVSGFRYSLPNKRIVWMHRKAQVALTEKINMDGGTV